MYGVVYGVECLVNHKIYVGQTQYFQSRISHHKSAKTLLGYDIRKYKWENFVCVVLEECDSREQLIKSERMWIEKINCKYPNGYNLTKGGEVSTERPVNKIAELIYQPVKLESDKDYYPPVKIF